MADELNNESLELNKITVNGYEFEVTDSSARTNISEISGAITLNNVSISSRINNLNGRLETIENSGYVTSQNLEDDEKVIAAALNDLNDRLTVFESGSALSNFATESYVNTTISNLVDSAPSTLDTLNELAAALGDDANFASTVSTSLGNKVDKTITVNGHTLSSNVTITQGDVGLGNVDNTSDANKPISTATQTAINNLSDRIDALNNLYQTINTRLGGLTFVKLTQQQYDNLQTKDPNTLYVIND